MSFNQNAPFLLEESEQLVFASKGRKVPTLADLSYILIFAQAWFLAPALAVHYHFRPLLYVITKKRVFAVAPDGILGSIEITDIARFKGSKKSLLLTGAGNRLWLSRLPDAWHFEAVIRNVIEKVGGQSM